MENTIDTRREAIAASVVGRKAFSCTELAEAYGYPASTIYSYAKRGIIPSIRIGGTVRILAEDWERFIDSQRANSA